VQPTSSERIGRAGRGVVRAARGVVRGARGIVRRVSRIDPLAWLPPPGRAPGERAVVGVVGFYGHGNYGDELFLEVFREHLGSEFELRPLLVPGGGSLADRLGAGTRGSHAIVIGGGDIVVPWSTGSRYWERAYLRRPVFIAGVGVPTWRAPMPHVVRRLAGFFGHPSVRFVATRDPESTSWIEANLHPRVPVGTAPDLVCALSLPPAAPPAGPPVFGVAVRSRSDPDDLTHVRRLCDRAVELGYRVRRIVLATGRVRERDLEATARLGLEDTELVSSDDLDEISRAIGECTAFASMKFHGVVAATMYGVPTIALMPTAKTRNFLRGIDRLDLLSAYSDPDLPTLLRTDLAPIAAVTRDRLRTDAVAHLADLREHIGATVGR
jgi:polysaccharide pyruvyl transferase WcaK-like protein